MENSATKNGYPPPGYYHDATSDTIFEVQVDATPKASDAKEGDIRTTRLAPKDEIISGNERLRVLGMAQSELETRAPQPRELQHGLLGELERGKLDLNRASAKHQIAEEEWKASQAKLSWFHDAIGPSGKEGWGSKWLHRFLSGTIVAGETALAYVAFKFAVPDVEGKTADWWLSFVSGHGALLASLAVGLMAGAATLAAGRELDNAFLALRINRAIKKEEKKNHE